jgi:hypothetical protein
MAAGAWSLKAGGLFRLQAPGPHYSLSQIATRSDLYKWPSETRRNEVAVNNVLPATPGLQGLTKGGPK